MRRGEVTDMAIFVYIFRALGRMSGVVGCMSDRCAPESSAKCLPSYSSHAGLSCMVYVPLSSLVW